MLRAQSQESPNILSVAFMIKANALIKQIIGLEERNEHKSQLVNLLTIPPNLSLCTYNALTMELF